STLSAAALAAATQAKELTDQAAITAAEQAVTTAATNLAAATLSAPIAGVVGAISLIPGQSESSSAGITIVGTGAATVTLPVSLAKLPSIKVGQAATVTAPGLDPITGVVSQIALLPVATGTGASASSTVSYDVTVTLPDTPTTLATGSYVRTSIATATAKDVLTLPVSALPGVTSGAARVAVLKGSTTTETTVKVGAVGGGLAEIQSGLAAGDQVVIADINAALPTNSSTSVRGLTGGGQGGPPGGTRTGTGAGAGAGAGAGRN
ncbi:hypothetical protein, partial [Lapillicoccus sp.]|uniref:efflux RND transporter periplasmic adaptor subunit n=1 Tax=Lapillicoccus sp. TaxID=1909287 RepID=UPI003267796B